MKRHLFLAGAGLMCGLTVNAAAPGIAELPCRWERLNLDGGGYIGRIVTDPSRAGRVYCLSDKGGIHRSDDGWKSWVIKNRQRLGQPAQFRAGRHALCGDLPSGALEKPRCGRQLGVRGIR